MIEPIRLVSQKPQLEIRELTPDEIQTLAPDFAPHGLPDAATSTAVGIIEDGKIVGYQFLRLMLHVQPTKLDEKYSHMFSALCRKSEETILAKCGPTWTYVFCRPGRMAALAESRGMTAEPWVVMSKLVRAEDPSPPVLELTSEPDVEVPIEVPEGAAIQ